MVASQNFNTVHLESRSDTDKTEKPLLELNIKALFLIWGLPQGSHRSQLMAQVLGMEVAYVYLTSKSKGGRLHALLKYAFQAIKTPFILARRRPQVVFIQNPPIFGALVVYLWGLLTGTKYIIDSHTDALLASWWAWSLPLHRFLSRRAITTMVTNSHLQQVVADWGVPAFVLEDPPTTFPERHQVNLDSAPFNVVFVSTASYDEPIEAVLQAARDLPNVKFYVTGNYAKARRNIIESAPANVQFTGYVPDDEFYGLLEAAQVIMCLTTEDHTIQSGAAEALWLGRPIITSNWSLLRSYFNQGTIHVDNTAADIGRAIVTMRDKLPVFEAEIRALQEERRYEWQQKAKALIQLIQQAGSRTGS